jgi:hypothetical protein
VTELVGIGGHGLISTDNHFLSNKAKTSEGAKGDHLPTTPAMTSRADHLSSTSAKTSKCYQLPSILPRLDLMKGGFLWRFVQVFAVDCERWMATVCRSWLELTKGGWL